MELPTSNASFITIIILDAPYIKYSIKVSHNINARIHVHIVYAESFGE